MLLLLPTVRQVRDSRDFLDNVVALEKLCCSVQSAAKCTNKRSLQMSDSNVCRNIVHSAFCFLFQRKQNLLISDLVLPVLLRYMITLACSHEARGRPHITSGTGCS